jgi:intracellular septation protein
MKFLFDLFPILLFFGIFKWGQGSPEAAQAMANDYLGAFVVGGTVTAGQAPILLATAVAIIASFGQIGYLLARRRKVEPMMWISVAIIVVFGGATIYFNNETFIKWKPTVLYWSFAGTLLLALAAYKKNLIRSAMGKQITLPDAVWDRLNLAWIGFFIAMGVINIYVAFTFSTETWVAFKTFGLMGLMFFFIIGQSLYLSKYIKDPE